jgi:sporulation protein YlmC with PRC-barrel domain
MLLLTAGLLAATGNPLLAQEGPTPTEGTPPAVRSDAEQRALDPAIRDMRLEDLEGMEVHGAEGETVGEIGNVIRGTDGRLLAVVDTQSWLGITEGAVAIPLEFMRRDGDALRLPSLTKDQVTEIQEEDATDYGDVSGYETIGEAWDSRLVD